MTVASSVSKVIYDGDGQTNVFSVPFLFSVNSDITVIHTDEAGVETVWTENSEYTLSGAGKPTGGFLTVKTVPVDCTPQNDQRLTIKRVVPQTQETDYPDGGEFPAKAHEDALDKLTFVSQQLKEEADRTLRAPASDKSVSLQIPNETHRASKFLAFDASGIPIAAAGTSADLTPVSGFIDTLLDAADAAAARVTLGLGGMAVENVDGVAHTLVMAANPINEALGADIASATTTDIGSATGNFVTVTGTTTIVGFGTVQAGTRRTVHFAATLTLTHDAMWLILPTGANIATTAGDVATFISLGSGKWRCTSYLRTDGSALASGVTAPYESSGQTIVPGGGVTLSHSLPTRPKLVQIWLRNVNAEHGYAVDDEVLWHAMEASTTARGVAVVINNSTQIHIRFGNLSVPFSALDFATGAAVNFTNANWQLVVRAWL